MPTSPDTTSRPRPRASRYRPANPAQLGFLRSLCRQKGTTFVSPRNAAEASKQIDALKALPDIGWLDRDEGRRELKGIRADFAAGYATAVDNSEVDGYGSAARWARD
jgi:hypothetical protein